MKRFLITTADERTWPKDKAVLFLGEWCRLYNRKVAWKDLDAEVMPYHWDDRKKLQRDYLYLQGLYEVLLRELAERLNTLHGVNNTLRYWRILVGPWLGYFVSMLFDRWEMIQRAVTSYSIAGVRVLATTQDKIVPNDMERFEQLYVGEVWNESVYSQLLQGWTTVPTEKVSYVVEQCDVSAPPRRMPIRRLKSKLAIVVSYVSQMLAREDEAFFLVSFLPIWQDLLLQWRLGQFPKIWRTIPTPKAIVDLSRRQWQMSESDIDGFQAIARAMIPRHIPALYLEGYVALCALCGDLPWPPKPRFIFTSNSDNADDVFKAWAAEKVEKKSPLVIGQHGGNYGIGRWEFTEDHQCAISDGYLSWGWCEEKRPQIKPVCNLKLFGCDMRWDPQGHALMVEMTVPRYSYRMYSIPVAGQWLDYFNDQCRFVEALQDDIRRSLLVRLKNNDYGWCQSARWRERFPEIHLADGEKPIAPMIKKSRIYISTYNATTFLESLAMNIPTIMFWNPNHFELRDSAVPYFEKLKSIGIFHETPESAAYKMSMVWDDVATWWNSEALQTVRQEFCYCYTRMPEKPMEDLEQVLRQISKAAIE